MIPSLSSLRICPPPQPAVVCLAPLTDVATAVLEYMYRQRLFPSLYLLLSSRQAGGDQDLAVKFLVMAAEVAISCGDPAEAQLACAAVTQAVDDSGVSDHLTLLDQVYTHRGRQAIAKASAKKMRSKLGNGFWGVVGYIKIWVVAVQHYDTAWRIKGTK